MGFLFFHIKIWSASFVPFNLAALSLVRYISIYLKYDITPNTWNTNSPATDEISIFLIVTLSLSDDVLAFQPL